MIVRSIIVSSLVALAFSQYQKSSKDAAILSEARYLSVNGQFGAAYKQEDGVEFKEESDNEGNRRGSYSYVDPSGARRTVHYTAGKDGFKATGDHIPVPPVPVIPPAPALSPSTAPSIHDYNSADEYDEPLAKTYQPRNQYNYNNYHQFTPQNLESFSPPTPHKPISPYNAPPQSQFNQLQFQFQPSISSSAPVAPALNPLDAQTLFPGKLSLNRSPDGFSYTFNKI